MAYTGAHGHTETQSGTGTHTETQRHSDAQKHAETRRDTQATTHWQLLADVDAASRLQGQTGQCAVEPMCPSLQRPRALALTVFPRMPPIADGRSTRHHVP